MAEDGALEFFREIQCQVSDKHQVVSYKWLSRNFSVSSNHAKRLLHKFVSKHGNELEVLYSLAGWLKNTPQTYCIRLASGHNLEEVKKEFLDYCSVQVYSVQACIPKDLAVLWNAEFVQAEELFNQPSTTENCLRDNRFCGVSNSFVKRTLDGKPISAIVQLKHDAGTVVKPKANSILKGSPALPPLPPQQGPVTQSSSKHAVLPSTLLTSGNQNDRTASAVNDQSTKSQVKDSTAAQSNIKKVQNEKTSAGSGGSLASMWGRASAKSKSSSPALGSTVDVPNIAFSAEAQISADEAVDAVSSDDDGLGLNHNYMRVSNGASNRKRRVVMDFSDDDEEENVVSLASPSPPDGKPSSDTLHTRGNLFMEEKKSGLEDHKDDKLEVKHEKIKGTDSGMSPECEQRGGSKKNITGISLQKKTHNDSPKEHGNIDGDTNGNDKIGTSCSSPKRRKGLKTRSDERGREVTEVVWEDEAGNNSTEKKVASNDVASRSRFGAPVPSTRSSVGGAGRFIPVAQLQFQSFGSDCWPSVDNKSVAAGNNTSTNAASRAGNKKTAKGGGKDPKQGNILSFFKKV